MALVIKILPVQNIGKMKHNTPDLSRKLTFTPKSAIDRRKRKKDRRNSIRNGVHVRLTFKTDRRRGIDRRKRHLGSFRRPFGVCLAAGHRKINGKNRPQL